MVVTGCVRGAGETGKIDKGSATNVVGDGFECELEGVAEETIEECPLVRGVGSATDQEGAYVKSPVACGCLLCSSVRSLVRVKMSVLIFSCPTGGAPFPFDDMVKIRIKY